MMAPRLLKQEVRHPGDGPDLSIMSMAAELEVDAGGFCLFQMQGLVVQQNREALQGIGQGGYGLPLRIHPVVPADDIDALEGTDRIPQEADAGVGEELRGTIDIAEVFMIAEDGPYGGFQTAELGGIIAFQDGPDAPVHDVSADQDQVRMLGIDQVHPAGNLRPPVMISHM